MTTRSIPQFDLERLEQRSGDPVQALADLREAAREVGFLYLSGHGLDAALLRQLIDQSGAFFALPESQKLAVEMIHSPHFRGYTRVAREITRGQPDWREQIDIGAERAARVLAPGAPAWQRLTGPNQWPAALPQLRTLVLEWQARGADLLLRLVRLLCASLGQDPHALQAIYRDDPHILVKLIRYPGRQVTDSDQGVGAHKDSGLLSLLLQDAVGGLQVESGGRWIDVEPRPGTLVVNIGELLELASNGYLRATLHRVLTPPAGRERISVAFFLGARLDSTVPLLNLPPALAALASGPEADPDNPLLRDVGENYLKGRLRSHPDVASRYYGTG